MNIVVAVVCGFVGLVAGWLIFGRNKGVPQGQFDSMLSEKKELSDRVLELSKDVSRLEAEKISLEEKLGTTAQTFDFLQQKSEDHFRAIAQKILDDHSGKFQEVGERSIKSIIGPLSENLKALQESVIESKALNQDMSKETKSLVLALRGDSTTQGRWGELVLEQILKSSGLREGEEYIVQGRGLGLKDVNGETQKPDVIVNIPDQDAPKHIVVDSKVSLTDYDAFTNATNDELKQKHLEKFVESLKGHVKDLSGKKYYLNEKLSAPDFVLMFVPIEGAFALALQSDSELFPSAWDKGIILVSPTTLLVTLKTVASLWRHERASKNAIKIAEQAGNLYDKFESLLSNLGELGDKLKSAQTSYEGAMNKIKTGKGSLIKKVEDLRELGAKASKQIDKKYLNQVDE